MYHSESVTCLAIRKFIFKLISNSEYFSVILHYNKQVKMTFVMVIIVVVESSGSHGGECENQSPGIFAPCSLVEFDRYTSTRLHGEIIP
jgi:hypothetical protein